MDSRSRWNSHASHPSWSSQQNRPPNKRWIPPPAWNPGAPGALTFKQYLWTLAGWSRLTSMSWNERGIAVAMSLGGKAATIAQEIPVAILSMPQGLSNLLRRLDADLGSELQDRVKESARAFMRYRRPRGVSAAEHIVTFERLYADANSHCLYYSPVTLTMLLLESCQLTDSQEQWVMQCVDFDGCMLGLTGRKGHFIKKPYGSQR